MNNKKLVGIVAVLVIIALVIGGIYYYRSQEDRDLTLYGNVDIHTMNMSFRVGGRLASLSVDEGDAIKSGQTLGRNFPAQVQGAQPKGCKAGIVQKRGEALRQRPARDAVKNGFSGALRFGLKMFAA